MSFLHSSIQLHSAAALAKHVVRAWLRAVRAIVARRRPSEGGG